VERAHSCLAVSEAWICGAFDWRRVRAILESKYELHVEEDEELCILSADHNCHLWQTGCTHTKAVLGESRGIVLEKATGRIVCMPFHKFWNVGERLACTAHLDWRTAVASEKMDGTLLKLFWFRGAWRLAGNRSLDVHSTRGKYACTGRSNYDLFLEAATASGLDHCKLNPRYTYLLERMHPDFAIVIVPPEPQLWHLATRDMSTLQEVVGDDVGLPRPQEWNVSSLAVAQHLLNQLPGLREGLVIRDARNHRVKLKRADYVLLHMASNGCSNPDYSWVARSGGRAIQHLPVDRLCLAVWLRKEEADFVAYFPELRPRYRRIADALESDAFREEGWLPTDVHARIGATFVHEPRLWAAISMLVV